MALPFSPSVWVKVAGVSGFLAIGFGAYGSHAFKPENEVYKEVWKTANLYHLTHTAALLATPLMKYPNIFGGLMTFGIISFSGSCYLAAAFENRSLGWGAPFGGFAFGAGWIAAML